MYAIGLALTLSCLDLGVIQVHRESGKKKEGIVWDSGGGRLRVGSSLKAAENIKIASTFLPLLERFNLQG